MEQTDISPFSFYRWIKNGWCSWLNLPPAHIQKRYRISFPGQQGRQAALTGDSSPAASFRRRARGGRSATGGGGTTRSAAVTSSTGAAVPSQATASTGGDVASTTGRAAQEGDPDEWTHV